MRGRDVPHDLKVGQIRAILAKREAACSRDIENQLKDRVSQALLEDDVVKVIDLVLESVGKGVAEAVAAWHAEAGNVTLYFWPGYERIHGDLGRAVKQSAAPDYLVKSGLLESPSISEGVGWVMSGSPHLFHSEDMNTLWFNLVLRPRAGVHSQVWNDKIKLGEPPSTHNWFNPRLDVSLPRSLGVEFSDAAEPKTDSQEYQIARHVGISLPIETVGSWAHSIRELLRAVDKKPRLPYWPGIPEETESKIDARDRVSRREARLLLYDVWFAACFRPRETLKREFFEERIDAGLSALDSETKKTERWKTLRTYLLKASDVFSRQEMNIGEGYRAWYSIPILSPVKHRVYDGKAGDAVRNPYLGTAMLLSTRHIDLECMETIAAWIRSMFLELRGIEVSAKESETAIALLSNSFGHEVSKLGAGMFSRSMTSLATVEKWPQSPIQPDAGLNAAEREIVDAWKVVAVPRAHEALQDLLHTWGSVPFEHWKLEGPPLRLTKLVEALAVRARRVASARWWANAAIEFELVDDFQDALRQARKFDDIEAARPTFALNIGCAKDIVFHGGQGSDNRLAYVVRLCMALMSNAAFHAPDGDTIGIEVRLAKRRRARAIEVIITNASGVVQGGASIKDEFLIKTDGVAQACLRALGGTLDSFPAPHRRQGAVSAITSFTIPVRHPNDADGRAWIVLEGGHE